MIIDHRTYRIQHGKTAEYIALFENYALPVMRRHQGEPLGYFETIIGPVNEVVHLWGYADMADMEAKRAARDADPAWAEYKKLTAGMLIFQDNKIVKPTSFSPIK